MGKRNERTNRARLQLRRLEGTGHHLVTLPQDRRATRHKDTLLFKEGRAVSPGRIDEPSPAASASDSPCEGECHKSLQIVRYRCEG